METDPTTPLPEPGSRRCTKQGYTKKEAQTAVNARKRAHRGNGYRDKGGELRIYRCWRCNCWHLTSQPYDAERRARDRRIYRHSRRERRERSSRD